MTSAVAGDEKGDVETAENAEGAAAPRLRRDAERNLQLILAAARTVVAARGMDATLDEVAREAGLGVGTVYRRFRDKNELFTALFAEDMALMVADAEEAAARPDPWDGFVTLLGRFLDRQARDCGVRDLVSSAVYGEEKITALKARLRPVAESVVQRAQEAGALRPDFDVNDIAVIGVMLGAAVDFTGDVRPDAWQRYLALILNGLRAESDDEELVVPPLEEAELIQAMRCWRPRHCGPQR